MSRPLREPHRRDLESSGLTAETIAGSGCYSASAREASEAVGYAMSSGLMFPYLHTAQNGDAPYTRLKPDRPFTGENGRVAKYVSPKQSLNPAGNRLYLPGNLPPGVLSDPSVLLIVTEGEKKALAGCQAGCATIGLSGVACWVTRGKNGTSSPIADLDLVTWEGREVYIVFDSDATSKSEVRREERKLGRELLRRGAVVRIARLPRPGAREDAEHRLGGKFGLDDFLHVRGKDQLQDVLKRSRVLRPSEEREKAPSAADLAEQFLDEMDWRDGDALQLRWWREEFYRFTGTHYERVPDGDLRGRLNRWLRSQGELRWAAGSRLVGKVVQNLEAIALVEATIEPPAWLEGRGDGREYLALSNGLVALEEALAGRVDALRPHSPSFFNLGSLPFPLDEATDCSRWMTFLDEALPDPELQQLICEMFGYLLVYDTTLERFFLLEGAGANGKTVICTVLREILGPTNVSAVGLEAFSATRTFPLAATIGKKANIVEELDEITRAAEGTLKNFVTGKPMTIERKHRDAFEVTPTARLVFATNVLPRFVDPTDGLWRRMILIPFRRQILDESKQDKRLISATWWRESGELPAIFRWALGGLSTLRARGHFEEPAACRAEKISYRRDSNPAGTFVQERCEVSEGAEVSSQFLYSEYRKWAEDNGFRPLAATRFAAEVKRALPTVKLTRNARFVGGTRSRVWIGLSYRGDG